jgi:hypothetical protein
MEPEERMAAPQPPQRTTGRFQAIAGGAPLAVSPRGVAAAAFFAALAKASRSFTLYDPANAVVRNFLADYQAKAEAATAAGSLAVEVRPFQLVVGSEAVYQEEDREKSLSFRLFRDGLRLLALEPGVSWEELLRFLEILAVRFTGVRQQEDDVVTLLRKAEFAGIGFRAVEGYAPEEDNPEPEERVTRVGVEAAPPPGFDTPFPQLPAPGPIAFAPVPPALLEALGADERPEAAGRAALGAAAALLRAAAAGAISGADASQFLAEARDWLVADGQPAPLADLADLAAAQPPGRVRDELLRGLGDAKVLDLLVASLGEGSELPKGALRLVPLVDAASLLDRLAAEPAPARRAALLQLVEARLPADAAAVIGRLPGLELATAKALARALATRAPERAAAALLALLEHPDDGLKVSALEGLATVKGEVPTGKVSPLLGARAEGVRIAAAHLLERRGEPVAFQAIHDALVERKAYSTGEADALGRALARVHPKRAAAAFGAWAAARRGLLQKAFAAGGHEELLRWAAVSGLGALPGPEGAAGVEAIAAQAGEELKRHCAAVLARRRHEERARHG